jgi:hypothetical protein
MESIILIIVIGSTIWVGFDASTNKITTDAKPYNWANGAVAWVLGCILLWIVAFPWYLVQRGKLLQQRTVPPPQQPAPPTDPPQSWK